MSSSVAMTTSEATADNRKAMSAVAFSCFGWAFDLFDLFILLYTVKCIENTCTNSAKNATIAR